MFFCDFHRRGATKDHTTNSEDVTRQLMPFVAPDRYGAFETDRLLMVQRVTYNTIASKRELTPFRDKKNRICAAAWARIDNRNELSGKLEIPWHEMASISDTELILKTYFRWQEDCVNHLIGDFAFVLYDEKTRKVFCARDHMGVRPLYYYLTVDRFVCATSLKPLLHLKALPFQISRRWIVDYLTNLSMSFDKTPYTAIQKLSPAHTISVSTEHHRIKQYFELSREPEIRLKNSSEYVDAYREQLEIATKSRLETEYPLGSELSGGLDSSTITAYAKNFFKQPLKDFHAFSFANHTFEPKYISAVSQALSLPHTHLFTSMRHLQTLSPDRFLEIIGYPLEHGSPLLHEPFFQLAEHLNLRTLLSGFGGDEFSTSIHGYMVPMELIMQHRFRKLFNCLPGGHLFRFFRLMKLFIKRLKTHDFTLPQYNPRFFKAWNNRWPLRIVADHALKDYDLKQRYFDTARFDAGYTDLKRFTLEKLWAPFVPTRMENCMLIAAAHKIEYRWPLLDVRLVELFLRIPSTENYFRGMGRYLHRRAVDGVLPSMVAWKKSKDMGDITTGNVWSHLNVDTDFITNLHPALKELVDMEKVRQQAIRAAQFKTGQMQDAEFQIRLNLQMLKNLDCWLKQDWAQMPIV